MLVACTCLCVGSGLLIMLKVDWSTAEWVIFPLIASFGVGLLQTTPQFAIMSSLEPRLHAHSAGFYIVVRVMGQLLGVAIGLKFSD